MSYPIAPGRSCGSCSMCCKLLRIVELEKPSNQWCQHCQPGHGGCTIYESRPQTCRGYACGWLMSSKLGDEWYPQRCRMVLSRMILDGINCVSVHVDKNYPDAWRQRPHHEQLQNMARSGLRVKTPEQILLVQVRCDEQVWLLTGDGNIDISTDSYIVKLIGTGQFGIELFATQAEAQQRMVELTQ